MRKDVIPAVLSFTAVLLSFAFSVLRYKRPLEYISILLLIITASSSTASPHVRSFLKPEKSTSTSTQRPRLKIRLECPFIGQVFLGFFHKASPSQIFNGRIAPCLWSECYSREANEMAIPIVLRFL